MSDIFFEGSKIVKSKHSMHKKRGRKGAQDPYFERILLHQLKRMPRQFFSLGGLTSQPPTAQKKYTPYAPSVNTPKGGSIGTQEKSAKSCITV